MGHQRPLCRWELASPPGSLFEAFGGYRTLQAEQRLRGERAVAITTFGTLVKVDGSSGKERWTKRPGENLREPGKSCAEEQEDGRVASKERNIIYGGNGLWEMGIRSF